MFEKINGLHNNPTVFCVAYTTNTRENLVIAGLGK